MTNLVDQLREPPGGIFTAHELCHQAADEIERLRAALLKYSEHLPGCAFRAGEKPRNEECNCGLTALLWTGPNPLGRPDEPDDNPTSSR